METYVVAKSFLEMLQTWLEEQNFKELDRCEFKAAEMLRNYSRVVDEMEADKLSFLWKDPLALAVRAELKKLKPIVRLIDKLYSKRSLIEKEKYEQNIVEKF